MNEKWSNKYKQSIDCDNPKGFSQKAHCQGRKKTFKEMREYMRGFGIGPVDTIKPMASMGSSGQYFPNRRYATTMPIAATYRGPGMGTYKPMVTADKKIKEVSDKLKSKVLQRKIQKAKDKFFKNNKPKSLFNSTTKKD